MDPTDVSRRREHASDRHRGTRPHDPARRRHRPARHRRGRPVHDARCRPRGADRTHRRARGRHPGPHLERSKRTPTESSRATPTGCCRRGCSWPTTPRSTRPPAPPSRSAADPTPSAHVSGCATTAPGSRPPSRHRIFRRFDRAGGKRSVGGSGLGPRDRRRHREGHHGACTSATRPAAVRPSRSTCRRRPDRLARPGAGRQWSASGGVAVTEILIVEDEPQIAAFVRRGLESAGYETISPTTAARGSPDRPHRESTSCCSMSGSPRWTASRSCARSARRNRRPPGGHAHSAHRHARHGGGTGRGRERLRPQALHVRGAARARPVAPA